MTKKRLRKIIRTLLAETAGWLEMCRTCKKYPTDR